MDDFDYEKGMRVIVSIPDGEDLNDYAIFNAGWDDNMYAYVGQTGTIVSGPYEASPGGVDCCIRFDDDVTWWWDERYIRPADAAAAEQVPPMSESDFAEILS